MGWSNNLPPQIQTLPDGTTLFNGPIVVTDPAGDTVASVGTDGSISGDSLNINTISLAGNDLATQINNVSAGVIGRFGLLGNTPTINSSVKDVIMITSPITLIAGRVTELSFSGCEVVCTAGTEWVLDLVLYSTYPTVGHEEDSAICTIVSRQFGFGTLYASPMIFDWKDDSYIGDYYLGLVLYRASGSGSIQLANFEGLHGKQLTAIDMGDDTNYGGTVDPIPFVNSGTPPAPPPPPKKNYSSRVNTIWTNGYDGNGNQMQYNPQHIYQGNSQYGSFGTAKSLVNFSSGTLQSYLSGATFNSGYLYYYTLHTWNNSGGTAFVYGLAAGSSAPSHWPGLGTYLGSMPVKNPGWNVLTLSGSIMAGMKAGTFTGFEFYINSSAAGYYWYGAGHSESAAPYLILNYNK